MWDFLDKVVYINLDHREDRRQIMQTLFDEGQVPPGKVHRFSAIKHKYGIIGTAYSHIGILQLAKQEGWKRVLILEDDMQWVDFKSNYKKLEDLVTTPNWDVCMIGGLYLKTTDIKVNMALWTNGYITQSHYYDALISNFQRGILFKLNKIPKKTWTISREQMINKMICEDDLHNVDTYWVKLQYKDNWIGVIPKMLKQVPSWSDLTHNFEDHESTPIDLNHLYRFCTQILSMP